MHEHDLDCLWYKYKEKHGREAAHALHETFCFCYQNKNYSEIDHEFDCKHFSDFYQALVRGPNDLDIVFGKEKQEGFLRQPLATFVAAETNKLCCC